jgi:hypothetical protein
MRSELAGRASDARGNGTRMRDGSGTAKAIRRAQRRHDELPAFLTQPRRNVMIDFVGADRADKARRHCREHGLELLSGREVNVMIGGLIVTVYRIVASAPITAAPIAAAPTGGRP